jgi:HEAT repeat protein
LGLFGSNAKSAVPELIKLLGDPSSNVVDHAASTLKKIDPEAAAKVGVK